jgi:uncharacterized membrane protein YfcA
MKAIATATAALAASPALAHTGHIAETGGHNHWLGLAALILAALVGARLALHLAAERARRRAAERAAARRDL